MACAHGGFAADPPPPTFPCGADCH